MSEFDLIDVIVAELGDAARSKHLLIGPGDDAALLSVPPGKQVVATTDTLLADVHFPADAPAELIGYRALAVNLSDLAAMGAMPWYCLVASTLPVADKNWARAFAAGMRACALEFGAPIVGGNLSRGSLSVTVSAHGVVDPGGALRRSTLMVGDDVYVSGDIGAAGAALAHKGLHVPGVMPELRQVAADSDQYPLRRYYLPEPRLALGNRLSALSLDNHADGVGGAISAIDISDGLLAELRHLARASAVSLSIELTEVPVARGADVLAAVVAGDDYELLCAAPRHLRAKMLACASDCGVSLTKIGSVIDDHVTGRVVATHRGQELTQIAGYDHF